jgi:rhodanese-related sulfurtransferase
MDEAHPISPHELRASLGTAAAPLLIDVRRDQAFAADDRMIVGAWRRSPDDVERWCKQLPAGRSVVVYCVHGHEVSQGVAAALGRSGLRAAYLEGGISAWNDQRLPTRRKDGGGTDKWVTRERPKIDRIACPWLVSRFIEPQAEFIYVPADEVLAVAKAVDGTPYDVAGVRFGHVGDRCSFDAIVAAYDIRDPALDRLATIVRGADTSRPDLTPQCQGLLAISYGLAANFADDHEMLGHGMVVYDALYAWCRQQQATGAEPPVAAAG